MAGNGGREQQEARPANKIGDIVHYVNEERWHPHGSASKRSYFR